MNFILKYKGDQQPDLEKLTEVLTVHHARIMDDSLLPHSALLNVEESFVNKLQLDLEGEWDIYPEHTYKIPTTKKSI